MYLSYDTQSSFPGYIDMEFKEIVGSSPSEWSVPLSSCELFNAVVNGYYYDGPTPEFMGRVFNFEGDYKSARVSKRLIKKWCDKMARQ